MKLKKTLFNFFISLVLLSLPMFGQNDHFATIEEINNLNFKYYQSINKNPQTSLIYAKKAFSYFDQIKDIELKFKIAANYVTALFINEHYKEALSILDQIEFLEVKENDKAIYYTLRGLIENDLNHISQAETNYKKALELYVKLKDKDNEFTILNNLGLLYNNIGDYKKSLESYLKCYEIIKDLKIKVDRYKYYMNIGTVSYNLKDFDKALTSYFLALQEATKNSDTLRIFRTHEKIAQANVSMNKLDIAIDHYLKSLKGSRQLGFNKDVCDILLRLGDIYNLQGRKEIAFNYFQDSQKVASEFSFLQGEIEASLKLAIYYHEALNFEKARFYYNKIIKNKDKITNLDFVRSAYYGLSQIEKHNKNSSLSLTYLEHYLKYDLEIRKRQLISQEEQIETQYNLKQKEFELESLKTNYRLNKLTLKNQQQRVQWLILFSILIAVVFLLLLSSYLQKRKSQKLLSFQNEKINVQNKKLVSTNKEIKNKRKELSHLNQIKDQLLSIIAHDVKSPITDLYNLLFILRHNLDALAKEELKKNLAVIESSTSNLLHLLNNILNWTISQSSGNEIIISEFSLTELINTNLRLVESTIITKELVVESSLQDNPYLIKSDLNIINFALRNILSNAVKFTNKKGRITIKILKLSDSEIEVHIADSGIGFNEEIHTLLKNDVRRIPATFNTNKEKGYGIGLSLCKKMLAKIDSKISYKKNEPSGSIFILHINLVN
jgi:signal transduction histidine kinase